MFNIITELSEEKEQRKTNNLEIVINFSNLKCAQKVKTDVFLTYNCYKKTMLVVVLIL